MAGANLISKNQTAFDWLVQQHEIMLAHVIKLAEINSGSFNLDGLEKTAVELKKLFTPVADDCQNIKLTNLNNINSQGELESITLGQGLLITKNITAKKRILLVGHMDTVFPIDGNFKLVKKIDTNIVNGPGVADMKGGLIVMLFALKTLAKTSLADEIGWTVYISPDEEIGSPGSAEILAELAKKHHIGLVYEPALDATGLLAGQRKGSGKFTIVVNGLKAHAGRDFFAGINAIVALSYFIQKVHDLNGQRNGVTINVGIVEGGQALNVVPDLAIARLDVRTLQLDDEPWVLAAFDTISAQTKEKFGVQIKVHGKFGRRPKPLTGQTLKLFQWVQQLAKEIDLDLNWQATGGCCDGNNLAEHGLPTIDTLGVRGGKIHSHDEFLCCDSLVERAKLSAYILMKLAGGEYIK